MERGMVLLAVMALLAVVAGRRHEIGKGANSLGGDAGTGHSSGRSGLTALALGGGGQGAGHAVRVGGSRGDSGLDRISRFLVPSMGFRQRGRDTRTGASMTPSNRRHRQLLDRIRAQHSARSFQGHGLRNRGQGQGEAARRVYAHSSGEQENSQDGLRFDASRGGRGRSHHGNGRRGGRGRYNHRAAHRNGRRGHRRGQRGQHEWSQGPRYTVA